MGYGHEAAVGGDQITGYQDVVHRFPAGAKRFFASS
jgi:hypothetical protein